MSSTALYTAQILGGLAATAAAYVFLPRSIRPGQVVVITGGSRGLGFALAQRFGKAGAKLVLAARNDEELNRARQSLLDSRVVQNENDILLVSADLTDRGQAAGLIQAAISTFGRVDILVNNAGIIEVGPVEDQPLEAYDRAMATNFYAALYTTYAAMPHMLERHAGSIVNIASIGGKFAVPHLLPYVASKFALVGFSEGLHAELRHKGIRVTTVCPGLMRTGGEEHAHFIGNVAKEKAWFQLSAKTPGLAASVTYAADRIFSAVADRRAEITITPQAWLIARAHGIAPEITQQVAGLINHYLLPDPAADQPARPFLVSRSEQVAGEV